MSPEQRNLKDSPLSGTLWQYTQETGLSDNRAALTIGRFARLERGSQIDYGESFNIASGLPTRTTESPFERMSRGLGTKVYSSASFFFTATTIT